MSKKEIKVSLLYFKELYFIITFKTLCTKYVYHIWKPDGKCFKQLKKQTKKNWFIYDTQIRAKTFEMYLKDVSYMLLVF